MSTDPPTAGARLRGRLDSPSRPERAWSRCTRSACSSTSCGDPGAGHLRPQLDAWTADLERLGPDRVERRLVAGEPVTAVLGVVADCGADLVVVGTRGEGAHGAARLGSTSLRLAEGCRCPLVIVPREGPS